MLLFSLKNLKLGEVNSCSMVLYIYRQNCAMQNDLVIVIVVERDGCRGVGRLS